MQLAQVIDKGKGATNNEPSILIWEFHKYSDNKGINKAKGNLYLLIINSCDSHFQSQQLVKQVHSSSRYYGFKYQSNNSQ